MPLRSLGLALPGASPAALPAAGWRIGGSLAPQAGRTGPPEAMDRIAGAGGRAEGEARGSGLSASSGWARSRDRGSTVPTAALEGGGGGGEEAGGGAGGEGAVLAKAKYRRVMLKVSGEALGGSKGFGIDPQVLMSVAAEVAKAHKEGVQIAIVVGGGNYFRGSDSWEGLDRATGDYVGMLATTMNAVCLQSALESLGVNTRVQTAIEIKELAEPYIRRRAIRHLEKDRVVIFGAGTGNPFFTTDTAASLRAAEINAEVFLKATKVDGIYTSDPMDDPAALLLEHLSYEDVQLQGLRVMDETAVTLCKENEIPVVILSISQPGNILKAIMGEPVGTLVDWRPTEAPRQPELVQLEANGAGLENSR